MLVVVDRSNVAHRETGFGVDAIKNFVEGSLAGKCVGASGHDGQGDVDPLCSEGIV